MTSPGMKKAYEQGIRLTTEITLHKKNSGGVTVGIYGSKGSGKTTFLITASQLIGCENVVTGQIEKETILWRGRSADYWNWFPKEIVRIFIHRDDFDNAKFKDDLLDEIPKDELPHMEKYTSIKDLYLKLYAGKVNVIYEPTTYKLTERIKKMIQKRGVTSNDLFKSAEVDPVIFWFEFMDWLIHNKSSKFLTIMFDEADELLPTSPSGARWHLNLWAKDVLKDLRRRRISLFMACHSYTDLDGRILAKIQYKLYMKGCVTPSTSIVNRRAPIMLDPGTYYIERDGWGIHGFNKIQEKTIVLTYLHGEDNDDDTRTFGDNPPDIPRPPTTPQEISNRNLVEVGDTTDPVIRDDDGQIVSLDLSNILLPRDVSRDNSINVARNYDRFADDSESENGINLNRNDTTTDETDI